MPTMTLSDCAIEVTSEHEYLRIEAWGRDSVRIRASRHPLSRIESAADEDTRALVTPSEQPNAEVVSTEFGARLINGECTVSVTMEGEGESAYAHLSFVRSSDGTIVLEEQAAHFWHPGPRVMEDNGSGFGRLEQRFAPYPDEKIYGLGQHTHGRLDQKGLVLDLVQRNAEVTIPFLLSNRGYGFLWNSPALGRVELAENGTRWVADSARSIDYWVTVGPDPRHILARYADATGHSPRMPSWATGFWQSKLRYKSQEELMEVAREYHKRKLPLSVIVVDYFSWTRLGEWKLDPQEWPDLRGAVAELESMGIKLMASVWPSVNPSAENFSEMRDRRLLLGRASGQPFTAMWTDKGADFPMPVAFYDPTNPEARSYVWDTCKKNYFDDGVRVWWLDACEPEIRPGDHRTLDFWAGPGSEVANVYPRENARAFYEGMTSAGENEVVLLCRSAWAGSQRYGAAVWSGDIGTTWKSFQEQVRAGLNMSLSGIPWWTTDIGGFHGGLPSDPAYQELVVRWFQWALFLPIFRLHGFREPRAALGASQTGGPNEVWSFGDNAYTMIKQCLSQRELLRPYLDDVLAETSATGVPPLRAMFVNYPDDAESWQVEDQMFLGDYVLVAPILEPKAKNRRVYLPDGATWRCLTNDTTYEGGSWIDVVVFPASIPVFVRTDAPTSLNRFMKEYAK